jgi:hypothetical protein
MDMMNQPAEQPEGGDMKAKMAQCMSLMKEIMAEMGGEPAGDDRMSVEQAFGKGFQGDEVSPKY